MLNIFQVELFQTFTHLEFKRSLPGTLLNALDNVAVVAKHFDVLLQIVDSVREVGLLACVTVGQIVEDERKPNVDACNRRPRAEVIVISSTEVKYLRKGKV